MHISMDVGKHHTKCIMLCVNIERLLTTGNDGQNRHIIIKKLIRVHHKNKTDITKLSSYSLSAL